MHNQCKSVCLYRWCCSWSAVTSSSFSLWRPISAFCRLMISLYLLSSSSQRGRSSSRHFNYRTTCLLIKTKKNWGYHVHTQMFKHSSENHIPWCEEYWAHPCSLCNSFSSLPALWPSLDAPARCIKFYIKYKTTNISYGINNPLNPNCTRIPNSQKQKGFFSASSNCEYQGLIDISSLFQWFYLSTLTSVTLKETSFFLERKREKSYILLQMDFLAIIILLKHSLCM